jgi:hypothetical protein
VLLAVTEPVELFWVEAVVGWQHATHETESISGICLCCPADEREDGISKFTVKTFTVKNKLSHQVRWSAATGHCAWHLVTVEVVLSLRMRQRITSTAQQS